MGLWDKIKSEAKDIYNVTMEKTEEAGKVGKRKFEINKLKRQVEHKFLELGGQVYRFVVEEGQINILENEDIEALLEEVKKLEQELHDKEKEVEEIKAEYKEREESRREEKEKEYEEKDKEKEETEKEKEYDAE